jgi:CelD/BcsL family acetyltransferase involved in cellulose biosynthesis
LLERDRQSPAFIEIADMPSSRLPMTEAEILRPPALAAEDVAAWRALAAAEPAFSSPLLGPDFAQAVGEVRGDARIAVWRRGGAAIGFLPFHQRPGGYARPIGAPISDYHALVSAPDFGLPAGEALALAGLGAYRFTGLVDPFGVFGSQETQDSYIVQLDRPADAYVETLRAASPKKFKNWRRLDHKLGRDEGDVRLVGPDHSEDTFQTLFDWKREQLRRTGGHDFITPDWTCRLFRDLFARRDGDFQGLMIGLYAGDRLVSGHFGVRLGAVYHPWIAAADPELAAVSPGQVFLIRAIAAMDEMGLTTYDLGPGHDHYKRAFAGAEAAIGMGLATAAGPAGRGARTAAQVWALAGARPDSVAARLHRRLEVIAAAETTLVGRTKGLAQAIAGQARRRFATADEG